MNTWFQCKRSNDDLLKFVKHKQAWYMSAWAIFVIFDSLRCYEPVLDLTNYILKRKIKINKK